MIALESGTITILFWWQISELWGSFTQVFATKKVNRGGFLCDMRSHAGVLLWQISEFAGDFTQIFATKRVPNLSPWFENRDIL